MKKDRAKKPGKQKIEQACDEADAEDQPQEQALVQKKEKFFAKKKT